MSQLVGDLPEDETSAARHRILEFDDGEALFNVGGLARSIRVLHLDFTVALESKTQIDGVPYRYASSTGIIDVTERTSSLN